MFLTWDSAWKVVPLRAGYVSDVAWRWWHVELGDDAASWIMDVRVDEITGVRFVREPYPFPSFPGRESLTVQFLGPSGDTMLSCYVHELYDGERMRPEKLAAWRALRDRYGNRDESRVVGAPCWPPPSTGLTGLPLASTANSQTQRLARVGE